MSKYYAILQRSRRCLNTDGGTITALLGGTVLHTFDVQGIQVGDLFTDSFNALYVSPSTASVPFELRFTRGFRNPGPNVFHYADDLSIQLIPEPAALILMSLGVVGLFGFLGLRRWTAARVNGD